LEIDAVRELGGRGRPEKVYSLPRAMLGDNLSALSMALLAEAGSKLKMDAVAKHLAGDVDTLRQPIAKRLNLVVEKLNQMNYHARWEAGAEGPRVHFGHCPYAAIIAKHPELCNMDSELVGSLVGQSVEREERPETQRSICPFVFLIR